MELKLKIYITDEEGNKFLGIGVLWLLEEIKRLGSIRQAAGSLGISYAKAHRMVMNLEKALGAPVVLKRRGGASRNGATLTDLGLTVINHYNRFEHIVKQDAQHAFEQFAEEIREALHGKQ